MNQMDELQRSRILACVQALCASRYAREDNVPCQIEEIHNLNSWTNSFSFLLYLVFDTPGTELVKYFAECFSFIDEARSAGGGVLVHCFAGMSRR
ncbi:hypothetical protein BHE74_00001909 [Ensete ventricosum]|uniref:protein-tyrosine-phosphatase n=1 Tax=Ensete ventricosum TaxID=4639 RepID=A0A427B7I6_ENSVE|nr:hypothetical protein B296_00007298 [Ensete ventricosum]RWW17325.1 hypothetical protein GW17_00018750 [Ensete ventricosum]RWW89114.1 hypothetical protein BHE74_00001909 [Ensete ventricosum]RZR86820.1 hypothetical protein BHM03_00014082 [Ensete ventricosum]